MSSLAAVPGFLAACIAVAGMAQGAAGWWAARRLGGSAAPCGGARPPLSILKPLHGDEPLLEHALSSFCEQARPDDQIVFGVASAGDTALPVAERVAARFADRDIAIVVAAPGPGLNRKIANLINMLPAAKHELLVIADADIHAPRGYLNQVAAALMKPGTGLVTTVYAGLAAFRGLVSRLGAAQITHSFLPGALLARAMGRQDCLGATMAIHRDVLARIGGLPALLPHLADDAVLGQLVARQGLRVGLAATVPGTTVAERTFRDLFRHELRWARTIRSLVPVGFALSSAQFPLAWALLAILLSAGAGWSWGLLALCWTGRAILAHGIDRALGLRFRGLATGVPFWLLPLRDLMSVAVIAASFAGSRVEWQGQVLRAVPPAVELRGLTPGDG